MTLGNAAAARVRLIVRCKACGHRAEPDPAEMAQRYGGEIVLLDWRGRLVCSQCGSRNIDMVVTGTGRDSVKSPAYLNLPADGCRPKATVRFHR
jgi:hypothetical protein